MTTAFFDLFGDDVDLDAWGATNASEAGEDAATGVGRVPLASRNDAADTITHGLPDVEIVVVAKRPSIYGVTFVGVVKRVDLKGESISTVKTSSGAVYQVTGSKLPREKAGSQKIVLPRTFDDNFLLCRLDGCVAIDVGRNGNEPGSNGSRPLTDGAVGIGARVVLRNVGHRGEYKTGRGGDDDKGTYVAYGSALGIDVVRAGPADRRDAINAVFQAFASEADGYHRSMIETVHDACGITDPVMIVDTDRDAAELAAFYEGVLEAHRDTRIGVGKPWDSPLFNEESAKSWAENIEALKTSTVRSLNVLQRLKTSALTNSHVNPIVQFPTNFVTSHAMKLDQSGITLGASLFRANSPGQDNGAHPLTAGAGYFQETTFRVASDKRRKPTPTTDNPDPPGRTENEIHTESVRAIPLEAAAWCFADAANDRVAALTTDGRQTMGVKSCTDSAKCGEVINALGVYDYFRGWMMLDLLEETGIVWFASSWAFNPPRPDGLKPQLASKPDYGGHLSPNLIDVARAIETNGVRVTDDFVRTYLVDDDGCFVHPTAPLQQELETPSKAKRAPEPPMLKVHGYQCLNSNASMPAKPILKKTNLEYYVIYENYKIDVLASRKINSCPTTGSVFLTDKFGDSLKDVLANKAAVYAVVAASSKRKRDD